MRLLRGVWRAADLLATARDLTRQSKQFDFTVLPGASLYLETEYARIDVTRNDGDAISAEVSLRAARGWLLTTDQDEAGVYIVAKRKPLIGSIGEARIHISLPKSVHLSLNLRHCQLCFHDVDAPLELPPSAREPGA